MSGVTEGGMAAVCESSDGWSSQSDLELCVIAWGRKKDYCSSVS